MVGGLTCSAVASWPRVMGPPKTTTESAESRGAESPLASSSLRRWRRRWIAAEWSWSASASASRSRLRDVTHEADDVSLTVGNGGDPDLAPVHARNDVG